MCIYLDVDMQVLTTFVVNFSAIEILRLSHFRIFPLIRGIFFASNSKYNFHTALE